ncbi:NAD(P)H-hydrate epimerase [Chitinophaga sp. YR573]|uniref:NAD(P)H-hydrate dehydratase n=1 Tax=Chitinophaga sp. YR573 TaxID=1881040 RepID=UPI0008B5692D|nr:NAD(P)H-hydrate dehydratase [Chitinophaga sp. YR573]SEV90006.1 NAD(P)H-hydrate epimerase [Chitinophaga sp. YR573]
MKIFTALQIREADAYTIRHTPISSLALMEKAALACTDWLAEQHFVKYPFAIFCGMGNNGGDGLAITRMLRNMGCEAHAYILPHSQQASEDHQANYKSLQRYYPESLHTLQVFPELAKDTVIIDAILGTGLSRPAEGLIADIISRINSCYEQHTIIAIDIPSGLLADTSSVKQPAVQAHHTLSFEVPKLAFLLPENAVRIGEVHILSIGLHPDYIANTPAKFNIMDGAMMRDIYKPRKPFSHKGTFGHVLLIAGSYGKMGAAILSAKSCLQAGVGLLTCHIPRCGYDIMQISVPAAMCITDEQFDHSSSFPSEEDAKKYKTIGIGPGLGTAAGSIWALDKLLDHYQQPMVIDADALNLLSTNPKTLAKVPENSILTPHPKEFERLFGKAANDIERLELLSQKAVEKKLCILLKGRYTAMASPDGELYFNATGNPGMATGGSGDVLTGIITSLVAQGYSSKEAMLLGVYIHGLAGDFAAAALSQEAMTAEDIPGYLGRTFLTLHKNQ